MLSFCNYVLKLVMAKDHDSGEGEEISGVKRSAGKDLGMVYLAQTNQIFEDYILINKQDHYVKIWVHGAKILQNLL